MSYILYVKSLRLTITQVSSSIVAVMASVKPRARRAPLIDSVEGRLILALSEEMANVRGGLATVVEVVHAMRAEISAMRARLDKLDPAGKPKGRRSQDRRRVRALKGKTVA